MKNVFFWSAPAWLLALSGCASVPDAPRPFPLIAEQYSAMPDGVARDGAAVAPQVLDTWWTLFDEPLLDRLVAQALQASTEARMSMARVREARALREAALTQYRPQGGLRAGGERRGSRNLGHRSSALDMQGAGAGVQSSANLDLLVSWELDLFGRGDALQRQADGDFGSAIYGAYAERAALVAEVARTWFEAQRLTAALADAQATVAIQTRLQEVLARKVERGLAPVSESARVDAGLLSAQANALVLKSQLDATRRALLVLVGMGDEPLAALDLGHEQTRPPALPQAMPAELLSRRPDVLQARAQMQAAAGGLDLARLALLPSVTLTPGIGLNWQKQAASFGTGFWSLAGNAVLPVLDRPRLLANARAQGARAEQAVIAYEQVVQRAFSEADQALLRMAPDERRIAALEQAQQRARAAYEAAVKGYGAGFFDLIVVLDSELVYREARVALTNARAEALTHAVQVFQSLGGGWVRGAQAQETESNGEGIDG